MDQVPSIPMNIDVEFKARKQALETKKVLETIFSNLDVNNLCNIRLVCKNWKNASNETIKEKVRWKIEEGLEARFYTIFICNRDDIFKNFHICGPDPDSDNDQDPDGFLEYLRPTRAQQKQAALPFILRFGNAIIDLKIGSVENLKIYFELTKFLPNLECLEFNQTDEMKLLTLFESFPPEFELPSLKQLSFKYPDGPTCSPPPHSIINQIKNNWFSLKLIENTPQLSHLNIQSSIFAINFLSFLPFMNVHIHRIAQVESLRLKLESRLFGHFIRIQNYDIKSIMRKFTNLKVLSLEGVEENVTETIIFDCIQKLANKLEELNIKVLDKPMFGPDVETDHLQDVSFNCTDDDDTDPKIFELPKLTSLPSCPKLKILKLINWKSFNNFNVHLPSLQLLQLQVQVLSSFVGSPIVHSKVTSLSFKQQNPEFEYDTSNNNTYNCFKSEGIIELQHLFPCLTELDVQVYDDDALRVIFSSFPTLKSLNLNESQITDAGMTGIPKESFLRVLNIFGNTSYSINGFANQDLSGLRQFPNVGNLTNLQHFSYSGETISNFSIYHGFTSLKDLRTFKLPPHYIHSNDDTNHLTVTKVNVRPLADNCPLLRQIDVSGLDKIQVKKPRMRHLLTLNYSFDGLERNSDRLARPRVSIIMGCGIPRVDVDYLKSKLPNIEIIYGDRFSFEEFESKTRRVRGITLE